MSVKSFNEEPPASIAEIKIPRIFLTSSSHFFMEILEAVFFGEIPLIKSASQTYIFPKPATTD